MSTVSTIPVLAVTTLITAQLSQYSDLDPLWRQFVIDYKSIILENSQQNNLSADTMNIVKYNMLGYLRFINSSPDLDWIIYYINDVINDVQFNNISVLYIPSLSYISQLYQLYQTTTALQVQ